jgi:hypothetical protein
MHIALAMCKSDSTHSKTSQVPELGGGDVAVVFLPGFQKGRVIKAS